MLALLLVGLGGMLPLALLLGPWPGRRVRLHPGPDGSRPRQIQALAHYPLRRIFHRHPDAPPCTRRLHLLSWGRKVFLEKTPLTRIELPPMAAGTYTFSCMRGRLKGTIQLIEQGANA